jgi:hypothetical protein
MTLHPERYEEMKTYIRDTRAAGMPDEKWRSQFMERFGKATIPEAERAMAELDAEAKAEYQPDADMMVEVLSRLRTIAKVLQREHDWLKPKVDYCRKIDDDSIAYEIAQKWIDEAETAEKRAEDNLVLQRKQTDTHLENIRRGAEFITDIVETLKLVFSVEEKAAP